LFTGLKAVDSKLHLQKSIFTAASLCLSSQALYLPRFPTRGTHYLVAKRDQTSVLLPFSTSKIVFWATFCMQSGKN